MIVGTRIVPPFSIKNEDGTWNGLSIELWNTIAADLQLDFEFRECSLQELITKLESGDLDASVEALTMTAEREERFDFSHPFFESGAGIAIRKKTPTIESLWKIVVLPLMVIVGMILIALFVAGTLIWLVERKHDSKHFHENCRQGIGDGIWWAIVTMTTVGYGDKTPHTLLGKALAFIWMLTGIIIITLFTAFVTSRLTAEQLSTNITSIADLTGVTVGSVRGSASSEYLRDNGISSMAFDNTESALKSLSNGNVGAVVYDHPTLRYLILQSHANLIVLPTILDDESYAFAFPTGSELREPVDQKLLQYIDTRWWKELRYQYLGR